MHRKIPIASKQLCKYVSICFCWREMKALLESFIKITSNCLKKLVRAKTAPAKGPKLFNSLHPKPSLKFKSEWETVYDENTMGTAIHAISCEQKL